ncbi:MAG: circadian clock KaiB family protein [Bacteroidales bacterium]|nr:circadian clock KaiB family protein [Bacteroidales bacterium]
MMNIIKLKLFISGATFRSQKAREYAGLLVAGRDDIELDIIDVVKDPDAAEASKVLATPTPGGKLLLRLSAEWLVN